MMADRRWVLERRLAIQGLGSRRFESAVEAVRRLGCVQAQDLIPALSGLGYRAGQPSLAVTAGELTAGAFLRTHILRPTWHFVAAEDLRWVLAATSPKVERGLGHRHQALGLDARAIDHFLERLSGLLRGRTLSRPEIRSEFPQYDGSALGHLLLVAELRAVICSGPFAGRVPTYRLVDELVALEDVDVDEAKRRLVHRFFAGHGPAEIGDLTRWAALTKSEVRTAIADLSHRLEHVQVDGIDLYHDPSIEAHYASNDYLLHTFDEVTLTYPRLNFPRSPGNPLGETPGPFLDDGWSGTFLSGTVCPGGWRLFTRAGRREIRLFVSEDYRSAAATAAGKLLAYLNSEETSGGVGGR